jgi:LPS export ABC transporter protein LptC
MRRISLLLIPGLIAIAIYTGVSTFETLSSPDNDTPRAVALDYDGYSEGINTVLYDAFGNISYTLQADRQVHYNDDRTELDRPYIRLFEEGSTHWNIVANSGKISSLYTPGDDRRQSIELSGNIEVYSLDEFGNRMQLTTDYLLVDPHSQTLETEAAVTLVTQRLKLTAIGMYAALDKDEVIFKRDTEGQYDNAMP